MASSAWAVQIFERCSLPTDVLLASLKSEAERRPSLSVDRYSGQATRHRALEGIADRHVSGVGTAESERNSETLGRANDDVGAVGAGCFDEGECENVGCYADGDTRCVSRVDDRFEVRQRPPFPRVLNDHPEKAVVDVVRIANDYLQAERRRTRLEYGDGLRETSSVDKETIALMALGRAMNQSHCFGRGGGFVQE